MNTQETRSERKEITLEQFLEAVKDKRCRVESPDIDIISIDIRGCCTYHDSGMIGFQNPFSSFEIDEDEINGIYVESDTEFYVEFGDKLAVMISIISHEAYIDMLKTVKQALSEISDSIIKTI